MPDIAGDDVRQIVREETGPKFEALAGKVAGLATKFDGMDRKIDTLTGMVDRFTKNLETERDERVSADRLVERRVEKLEKAVFPASES